MRSFPVPSTLANVLFVAALGACNEAGALPRARPPRAPAAPAQSSSLSAVAAPGPREEPAPSEPASTAESLSCDALLAPHRALRKRLKDEPRGFDSFGHCHLMHNGAWLVVFDRIVERKVPSAGIHLIEVDWSIVRAGRSGNSGKASYKASWDGYEVPTLKPPVIFDYDGDGEAELFMAGFTYQREDPGYETSYFVTSREGCSSHTDLI